MKTAQMEKVEKQEATGVERASNRQVYTPAVDIYEQDEQVILLADMPGVDSESINVILEKNVLTLSGKAFDHAPEKQTQVYAEYGVGDYQRVFQLGAQIDQDKIEAVLKDGVLRLVLPKLAPSKKKISVQLV